MPDDPTPSPRADPPVPIQYAQTAPFLQTARNGYVRISAIDWVGYDPSHGSRTCIAAGGDPSRIPVLGTLDEVMAVCGFAKASILEPAPQPVVIEPHVLPPGQTTDVYKPVSSKQTIDKQGS